MSASHIQKACHFQISSLWFTIGLIKGTSQRRYYCCFALQLAVLPRTASWSARASKGLLKLWHLQRVFSELPCVDLILIRDQSLACFMLMYLIQVYNLYRCQVPPGAIFHWPVPCLFGVKEVYPNYCAIPWLQRFELQCIASMHKRAQNKTTGYCTTRRKQNTLFPPIVIYCHIWVEITLSHHIPRMIRIRVWHTHTHPFTGLPAVLLYFLRL